MLCLCSGGCCGCDGQEGCTCSGVTRLEGVGPAGKKLSGRAQLLPQGQCFTAAPLWSFPLVWADKALVTALSREAKTKSGPEEEGLC